MSDVLFLLFPLFSRYFFLNFCFALLLVDGYGRKCFALILIDFLLCTFLLTASIIALNRAIMSETLPIQRFEKSADSIHQEM